jgi:hypothetical protein
MIDVNANTAATISNTVANVPLITLRKYRTTIAAAISNRMILSAEPKFAFIQKNLVYCKSVKGISEIL